MSIWSKIFPQKQIEFVNCEGIDAYNFTIGTNHPLGISALIRVQNDEDLVRASILSVLDFVDEIVVVDNSSTDATSRIIKELMYHHAKIRLEYYPFHMKDDVESLSLHHTAYFRNWCQSRCQFSHVLEWNVGLAIPSIYRDDWHLLRHRVLHSAHDVTRVVSELVVIDDEHVWRRTKKSGAEVSIFQNTRNYYFSEFKEVDLISSSICYELVKLSELGEKKFLDDLNTCPTVGYDRHLSSKVFCIGVGRTGTKSLTGALNHLEFHVLTGIIKNRFILK